MFFFPVENRNVPIFLGFETQNSGQLRLNRDGSVGRYVFQTVEKNLNCVFGLIRLKNWAESNVSRNLVVSAKFNHEFVIAYA